MNKLLWMTSSYPGADAATRHHLPSRRLGKGCRVEPIRAIIVPL